MPKDNSSQPAEPEHRDKAQMDRARYEATRCIWLTRGERCQLPGARSRNGEVRGHENPDGTVKPIGKYCSFHFGRLEGGAVDRAEFSVWLDNFRAAFKPENYGVLLWHRYSVAELWAALTGAGPLPEFRLETDPEEDRPAGKAAAQAALEKVRQLQAGTHRLIGRCRRCGCEQDGQAEVCESCGFASVEPVTVPVNP